MDRALSSGPIVWFGIIVTTCLLLVVFQTVLWLVVPILLAIVSYYVLSPLVNMAMARGITRARSVLIVTAMLCVFLVAVGAIFFSRFPITHASWRTQLNTSLSSYADDGINMLISARNTLSKYSPFFHPSAPASAHAGGIGVVSGVNDAASPPVSDNDEFRQKISEMIDQSSGNLLLELGHWIPSMFLIPVLTYYFLLDGPRFKRFLVQAIPNAFFEKGLYLFYRVEDQIRRYFQGVLMLTAIDGTCLGVGLWFLGIPGPFFLAAIAAVLAWLPYIGSVAGCLLVVLVAAHHAPAIALNGPAQLSAQAYLPYEAVALFIGVRLLDDFVFLPLTIGRSLRMHPLVAILMILLGGAVAGFAGLLLVLPVLGVVMVAGQIIGELASDPRIIARHRHAKQLRRARAMEDLA
jgi:predicted PurR-regulated permease PerM